MCPVFGSYHCISIIQLILSDSLFLKKTYLSVRDSMSATVIMWPLCSAMHVRNVPDSNSLHPVKDFSVGFKLLGNF